MQKPRVSIITSIYKSENFMEHFLHDVSRQTIFPECEILLLNADSPENEEKYILPFQKVFPNNVIYKKLDEKLSIYQTWNLGVRIASSDILTNWNTDDRRAFNSLELQVEEFEKDLSLDVCYGPTLTTYNPNELVENCLSKNGFGCFEATLESMLENNSPHCLPMWRKDLHNRYGYFSNEYRQPADYEFWLRVLVNGAKFKKINKLIGSYYRNPDGDSSRPEAIQPAIEEQKKIQEIYRKYLAK